MGAEEPLPIARPSFSAPLYQPPPPIETWALEHSFTPDADPHPGPIRTVADAKQYCQQLRAYIAQENPAERLKQLLTFCARVVRLWDELRNAGINDLPPQPRFVRPLFGDAHFRWLYVAVHTKNPARLNYDLTLCRLVLDLWEAWCDAHRSPTLTPRDSRNKWCYEQWQAGKSYKQIHAELKGYAEWEQVSTPLALRGPIRAWAKKNKLRVRSGQPDKPKRRR